MSIQPQNLLTRASAAAIPDDNRSLTNLRMELDEDVDVLKYLPYSRATFQLQRELQGAAADRLLYGDMMDEKDQLWIYFTLLGGGRNYNKETGGNRMITFHTLKGAQNGEAPLRAAKVQDVALASAPFKFATNSSQVMAIAKYYFIKRGVDATLTTPLSVGPWKSDLIAAGKEFQTVHEYQEARRAERAKQEEPAAGSSMMIQSREGSHAAATLRGIRPETHKRTLLAHPSPQDTNTGWSLKRPRNSELYNDNENPSHRSTPSPSVSQIKRMANERLNSQARDSLVEKYIQFQTEQEDYDRRIDEAESKRASIAAEIVGLQAKLIDATNEKAALMESKHALKMQKKELEESLGIDEHVEFGFEAGRRMERKRAKRA